MNLSLVKYSILRNDEEEVDAEARHGGVRIGWLWCERDGDGLKISDLHVEQEYRGHGIGDQLLRMVLEAADRRGISAVWGLITADDLKRSHHLPGWYERRGFQVVKPDLQDKQDLPGAAKNVCGMGLGLSHFDHLAHPFHFNEILRSLLPDLCDWPVLILVFVLVPALLPLFTICKVEDSVSTPTVELTRQFSFLN
jgi:GNAT superfamily N-acetyltransferase